MTRVNVGIDPSELPDKLLLAEHREITRIPNKLSSGKASLSIPIPKTFTLNTGHVRFFYNKLTFLKKRYEALYTECCKRGFNVTDKSGSFEKFSNKFWFHYGKDYTPTKRDRRLLLERIRSKGFKLRRIRNGKGRASSKAGNSAS